MMVCLAYVIFLLFIYVGVFHNAGKNITFLNYLDEITALVLLISTFLLTLIKNKKIPKTSLYIIALSFLLSGLGIMGNVLFKYQDDRNFVITDLFLLNKSIIVFVSIRILFKNVDISKFIARANIHIRVISAIFFILTVINIFIPIFPSMFSSEFFGIFYAQQLFYTSPTYLVNASIFMISILTANGARKNIIFISLLLVIIILTMRSKGYGFILLYVILYYISKKNIRLKFRHIMVSGAFAFIAAYEKIKVYYWGLLGEVVIVQVRAVLTKYSFIIANEHFPFGSGFATFASWYSGVSYSNVYYKYNISHIWGMQEDTYGYLGDTFWPMIIGQFGYLGLIIYLLILLIILNEIKIIKKYREDNYFIAVVSLIGYLFIASTSEASFVNPYAVYYFILIALLINTSRVNERRLTTSDYQ